MMPMGATPKKSGDAPIPSLPQVFDDYAPQLFALGLRFCGNRQDAEDLVQEVFIQAHKSWAAFEGRSSPKTWLYTIAARVCQRMHRRRAGQPAHIGSLDASLPFSAPRIAVIADEQDDQVQTQIRREAQERVEAAILALPDDYRIPLVLKEIVGFSVDEVAAILGAPAGTVKSRLHRARLRIRADVDAALPRQPHPAPPPAYPLQVCLDLLAAKQEALDHGVPFQQDVICDRCRSVFASLDLAQQACRRLGDVKLPDELQCRLRALLTGAPPTDA